jgi:hypothetical protein
MVMVEMEFVALGFRGDETVCYRYRLESRDLDWSPPAEQRTVSYARLEPGKGWLAKVWLRKPVVV